MAPPAPAAGDGLPLLSTPDGTLHYDDPQGRFTAIIHTDGRVEFRDRSRAEFGVGVAVRGRSARGVDIMRWLSSLVGRVGRWRSYENPGDEPGIIDLEDGFARVEYGMETRPPSPFDYGPVTVQFTFAGKIGGLGDLWLRRGQRRYAAAKWAFLEQTASLRARMVIKIERERRRAAFMASGDELSALWSDNGLSAAARRQQLFEWWDDCDERSPAGVELDVHAEQLLDAERARDAGRMRRQIEAFVRRVAPAGGPDAYSATELRHLNARRHSQQRFAPYTTPGEPVPGDDEV